MAPSHYLNQCWNIVNWTLRNKLQWTFNRNYNIFIHENAIESVVCEMVTILSRPQCVEVVHCGLALTRRQAPLSEPMTVSLQTHICVTWPQWDNSSPPGPNGHHFTDIFIIWTNTDPIDAYKCSTRGRWVEVLLMISNGQWSEKLALAPCPKG